MSGKDYATSESTCLTITKSLANELPLGAKTKTARRGWVDPRAASVIGSWPATHLAKGGPRMCRCRTTPGYRINIRPPRRFQPHPTFCHFGTSPVSGIPRGNNGGRARSMAVPRDSKPPLSTTGPARGRAPLCCVGESRRQKVSGHAGKSPAPPDRMRRRSPGGPSDLSFPHGNEG